MINNSIKYAFLTLCLTGLTSVYAQKTIPEISLMSILTEKGEVSFFGIPKTAIKLRITVPNGIFKIDGNASKLINFVDDRGTDILARGRRQTTDYISSAEENNIDTYSSKIEGNSIIVPINVTAIADKNAQYISVKANVSLYCYPPENSKKHTSGMITVTDISQKIMFNNNYVKLNQTGVGQKMDGTDLAVFELDTDIIINKMTFYDGLQQELVTVYPAPQQEVEIKFDAVKKIDKVNIEYANPVIVNVPVNFKTNGVGLI